MVILPLLRSLVIEYRDLLMYSWIENGGTPKSYIFIFLHRIFILKPSSYWSFHPFSDTSMNHPAMVPLAQFFQHVPIQTLGNLLDPIENYIKLPYLGSIHFASYFGVPGISPLGSPRGKPPVARDPTTSSHTGHRPGEGWASNVHSDRQYQCCISM